MQFSTMKLDEIVTWYQKKIGTYDKQQWEKTVEQKILDGFTSVTLKTAKLKTELIDVDLVRGSTFPKAKSKQSLLTVIRLAILRYFLLPIYAQWWSTQTSANCFALLLTLYVMQMINWAIYTFHVHRLEHVVGVVVHNDTVIDNTNITNGPNVQRDEHIISLSELLIPMSLGLLLSLIHSQIVATNTASGSKSKRRRFSNTNASAKHARGQEPRMRRRKKLVKVRSQEGSETIVQQRKSTVATNTTGKKSHSSVEVITKTYSYTSTQPIETDNSIDMDRTAAVTSSAGNNSNANTSCHNNKETLMNNSNVKSMPYRVGTNTLKLDLIDEPFVVCPTVVEAEDTNCVTLKKRNVNWHSPIHNYATDTVEKQQQTSPQLYSSTTTSESSTPNTLTAMPAKDSIPSNSSSASASAASACNSPSKTVRIDECVLEFYDDLLNRTDSLTNASAVPTSTTQGCNVATLRRHIGEDDGFESLNGKSGSSGEEMLNSPAPSTSMKAIKNQLRLRLNAGEHNHVGDAECTATSTYRRKVPLSSESDYDKNNPQAQSSDAYQQTKATHKRSVDASSEETEEEGDDGEIISSPASVGNNSNYNECTTSATEWLGVTTNSEECSYSSEIENSDNFKNHQLSDEEGYDLDFTPTTILNPYNVTDKISCTIWEQREIKKAQMSVLEISSCIIERVESMPETNDYIYFGLGFSLMLSLIPPFCRLCEATIDSSDKGDINYFDVPMLLWEKASFSFSTILRLGFGFAQWERAVLTIAFLQRMCLTAILFMIFSVAERTFKQRFLYAKLFSHLTSSRRARKSNVPHFRLNKVRNIKTWLSVRSYLKKRGPQRSVDVIVSAAFIVTLLLLAFLSVEWLKDSVRLHSHLNLEALLWSSTIGIFLLRFMTLGNRIHDKYRSVSVLITEQINLYLQIEQKPKKKEELMVANSVLKLAADLLKELESPFKISGLSANPYLFTTIKVVILSALSGVLSEMLGFKLKLHKIKIK